MKKKLYYYFFCFIIKLILQKQSNCSYKYIYKSIWYSAIVVLLCCGNSLWTIPLTTWQMTLSSSFTHIHSCLMKYTHKHIFKMRRTRPPRVLRPLHTEPQRAGLEEWDDPSWAGAWLWFIVFLMWSWGRVQEALLSGPSGKQNFSEAWPGSEEMCPCLGDFLWENNCSGLNYTLTLALQLNSMYSMSQRSFYFDFAMWHHLF